MLCVSVIYVQFPDAQYYIYLHFTTKTTQMYQMEVHRPYIEHLVFVLTSFQQKKHFHGNRNAARVFRWHFFLHAYDVGNPKVLFPRNCVHHKLLQFGCHANHIHTKTPRISREISNIPRTEHTPDPKLPVYGLEIPSHLCILGYLGYVLVRGLFWNFVT